MKLETMAKPVEKLPVDTLDHCIVGTPVRLANGSEVWGLFSNFDVHNPRGTQHFLTLSIERGGTWHHLERYFEDSRGPEALARFLGLDVDDIFPITIDVRRYVRGDPAVLTATVLKEPQERLTREELHALASEHRS